MELHLFTNLYLHSTHNHHVNHSFSNLQGNHAKFCILGQPGPHPHPAGIWPFGINLGRREQCCNHGSRKKFSYTWCKMNKCQLAKKITHGADKFTLGACHLVWIAVCTKSLNYTWWYGSGTSLHMVVVPFINVTLGARTKCVIHWREPCNDSRTLTRTRVEYFAPTQL